MFRIWRGACGEWTPFTRHLTSADPQPEPEEMRRNRMQVHRAMGLMAVQVNRDTGNRDVRRRQRIQNDFPPGQIQQPM